MPISCGDRVDLRDARVEIEQVLIDIRPSPSSSQRV